MASLKEVKTRIASVNSTRKITSAMKMVASSKLHHAQQAIEQMRPYERKLNEITSTFVASLEGDISSPYALVRPTKRAALLVFSSNSSLCGGFNANAIKQMRILLEDYSSRGIEVSQIYPIGKKANEAARKMGFSTNESLSNLLDTPQYNSIAALSQQLMHDFLSGEIDEVQMVYHHFKSAGTQVLTTEQWLPIAFPPQSQQESSHDFLVEPTVSDLLDSLIPKALHLKLYAAMLDSLASEHAARVIAMQVATDNADELLRDLTLQYNKTRQQAITAELLDIVGGSML